MMDESKGGCPSCGGELSYETFEDAWTDETLTTPSLEDCTKGLYCRQCHVVWIGQKVEEVDIIPKD